MRLFFALFAVLITVQAVSLADAFADEEYDLSDHPIYQEWVYDPERNISSERYSVPAISNQYSFDILDIDYDPTRQYYQPPVSTYDYCIEPQFAKYPKCR